MICKYYAILYEGIEYPWILISLTNLEQKFLTVYISLKNSGH